MKKMLQTRRSRELAAMRAALTACQERASVLAHERDQARALVASLTGGQAVEPAVALRPVGLTG